MFWQPANILAFSSFEVCIQICFDKLDGSLSFLNDYFYEDNSKSLKVKLSDKGLVFVCMWMQGISTYDYVIALREQEREQATGDQESPQMSRVSSMAGLSTTSPFIAFHRGAWCTPPRSFLEEQVWCASFLLDVPCLRLVALEKNAKMWSLSMTARFKH